MTLWNFNTFWFVSPDMKWYQPSDFHGIVSKLFNTYTPIFCLSEIKSECLAVEIGYHLLEECHGMSHIGRNVTHWPQWQPAKFNLQWHNWQSESINLQSTNYFLSTSLSRVWIFLPGVTPNVDDSQPMHNIIESHETFHMRFYSP
jgi:hypothetical protein